MTFVDHPVPGVQVSQLRLALQYTSRMLAPAAALAGRHAAAVAESATAHDAASALHDNTRAEAAFVAHAAAVLLDAAGKTAPKEARPLAVILCRRTCPELQLAMGPALGSTCHTAVKPCDNISAANWCRVEWCMPARVLQSL